MRFHKLTPAELTVFHDELDIAPGKVRLKEGGGHAGHNGLRSIHQHVGEAYARVRLGIGHPGHKDRVNPHVLSNFHKAAFEYVYSRYEWFSLFDGMIISYQHQTLKPEPAIYQILLATYSLIPEQCVFIDDSLANLAAASEFGIRGIHYETSEQLRLELNYILK